MTTKLDFRSALFLLLPALIFVSACKDMNLDIQDSKDRLDVLEGTTITSINEQISAINTSISDLKEMDESLDAYIKALEATATDLQKQINEANSEIAKLEAELGEVVPVPEQSLLNELNAAKEAIQAELTAINKTLDDLKAADTALDKKIADLRTYVETELASTKDWANATFSTLAQYEQTQTEISAIKASIEQINTDMAALETRLNGKIAADIKTAIDALRMELNTDHASRIESAVNNLTVAYTAAVSSARSEITTAYTNAISNAIIESESGMKAWVNTKLTQGYYDIATIDGKLQALSGRLDEADEELQKQIDQQKYDLETAKSELTSAYKKAINDAIQTNNGVISAEIAEAVQKLEAKINSRLSTIESQITAMQKGISDIVDDIDTIQKQIESINTTLGTLEDEDQELNSLIDKLESDYAALLQELEEIRPVDEISKKTIVDDIALLKEQVTTIFSKLDTFVLKEDFVNRIQSLKYIPEYSDGKVRMSEVLKTISLDFLVSPSSQAKAVQQAWDINDEVVTAYIRCTKNPETRAISPATQLLVTSVKGNDDGTLNVTMKEDETNPIDIEFFEGGSDAVVYIKISDGNSDIFSDMVDITSCVELSVYEDLSPTVNGVYQTANCYIVSKAGAYKFKTYKGNSQELAGSLYSDIHPIGKIHHAKVLWESFGTDVIPENGELISYVAYENEYLVFKTSTTFKEGNAVVSVRDDTGNILWSWHIWLTDQPESQEYYNNAGTMMDRNLGATSATPGDVGALGLLYQWGRKDPFLSYSSITRSTRAESTITWPSSVSSTSSTGTIDYAIANPTTFITNSYNDWYYSGSSTDNPRWTTSSSTKSIYDPCPAGWRVPDGGSSGVWSTTLGSSLTYTGKYDSINGGINFSNKFGDNSSIWYPASVYKGGYNNNYSVGSNNCCCWSASLYGSGTNYAYGMGLKENGEVYPIDYSYLASCRSVRCLKEQK